MRIPDVLSLLARYVSPSQPLYLVGGAVRDSLLGKPCSDIDLVCTQNPRWIARKFADEIGGDFFVLDDERDTCRVLISNDMGASLVVDFAAMRGDSIREDLAKRDFTINAMAVDFFDQEMVIDPFKGGRDLQEKRLRVVSPSSFADDPLRTIRAVRYALNLGLKMEPGMTDLILSSVSGLQHISAERKRDEIIKIFSGQKIHTGLQLLQKFTVFRFIPLAVRSDFSCAVTLARSLEDLVAWLCGEKSHEHQAAFYQSALLVELGRFREQLRNHYLVKNRSRRENRSLLYLAIILDGATNPECYLRGLALSVDEIRQVTDHLNAGPVLQELIDKGSTPEPIDIYRYFKATGSGGLDAAVTMLAKQAGLIGSEFSQAQWLYLLQITGKLMEAWFHKPELIAPIPLVNGEVLMRHLGLDAGPIIGQLLEQLKEEQVKGSITNAAEALQWIELVVEK